MSLFESFLIGLASGIVSNWAFFEIRKRIKSKNPIVTSTVTGDTIKLVAQLPNTVEGLKAIASLTNKTFTQ